MWRLAILFVVLLLTGPAPASATPSDPERDSPIYYNPATKSYFQLVWAPVGYSGRGKDLHEINWGWSNNVARSRVYKGVRGRLAVVKDKATNDFLRDTFHTIGYVWVGLRYWCGVRRLQWTTGEVLPLDGYENWDPNWNRTYQGKGCTFGYSFDYTSVAYTPYNEGFRWTTWGYAKEFYHFFVEYPTGKE